MDSLSKLLNKILIVSIIVIVCILGYKYVYKHNVKEEYDLDYNKVYTVEISDTYYNIKIKNIVNQLITDENASDFSKYKILHDWICSYVEYDYSGLTSSSWVETLNDPEYVVDTGLAVCGGYMRLYTDLCKQAGLECDNLTGYGDRFDPSSPHGWNRIKLNDEYYQVDVTWDDTGDGDIDYGWFAVGYDNLLKQGRRYDGLLEVCMDDYEIDRDSLKSYEFETVIR